VNQIRPGPLYASRQTSAPRAGLEADLEILAQLEGKPLPTVAELAQMFDVSQTTAHRIITRFKQSGLLRLVDRVRLPGEVCHCVADLRTKLLEVRDLDSFEARLRSDPAVSAAAAVTGKHSYRITALHRGVAEANLWFKALLAEPAVIDGQLTFCRPIIDRQHYARALLGD